MSDTENGQDGVIFAVYAKFRDYIEHEDSLVNDRISRTLLVHGFLLASGVLLIQARVEAAAKCMSRDQGCWSEASNVHLLLPEQLSIVLLFVDILLPIIAMIGVVTTRAALSGVVAAEASVTSLRMHWEKFASVHRATVDRLHLPSVTGGGNSAMEEKGHGSAVNLMRHLLGLWIFIFALTFSLIFVWHWPVLKRWPLVSDLLRKLI